MDLTTFFYALIGFTALAAIRSYQKMGPSYRNLEAKTRNHRRGEDQFFKWLVVVVVIIVLVMAWYGPGANA
jgi:hypothetical protein